MTWLLAINTMYLYRPLSCQSGANRYGTGEVKVQELTDVTLGIAGVLPEWVWFWLHSLFTNSNFTNLVEGEIDVRSIA